MSGKQEVVTRQDDDEEERPRRKRGEVRGDWRKPLTRLQMQVMEGFARQPVPGTFEGFSGSESEDGGARRGRNGAGGRTLRQKKKAQPVEQQLEPMRRKPGVKAEQEIRMYQRGSGFLMRKGPFTRLVREQIREQNAQLRFQSAAMEALQEGMESWLVGLIDDANLLTLHTKRITLFEEDVLLAQRIRGDLALGLKPEVRYGEQKPRHVPWTDHHRWWDRMDADKDRSDTRDW